MNPIRALRGFLKRREQVRGNGRRASRTYKLRTVESLETRRVLSAAGVLPSITGVVFSDINADDMMNAGEEVSGAVVRLYQDDGDGIFEPGTDDIQVGADAVTDANGEYCFNNLDQVENYFVQQLAQLVGDVSLAEQVSPLIDIEPQLIIDSFQTTQSTSALPPPISSDESSLVLGATGEVIGGERDLAVGLLAGTSEVQSRVNPFGLSEVLLFDSSAGTTGTREVTWDGIDNDGENLALGLGGLDLTQGGELQGLTMLAGVDANGANARFRLYQGSTANFSEVTVPIPVTGGAATSWLFIPFDDFVGGVEASNVDAIQLIIDTGNDSVDGQMDTIGVLGPEVANFDNDAVVDLELTKTVDSTTVNSGDVVTWTLSLTNNADNANVPATGVQVGDVLPAGVTFLSAQPSDGTFAGGTWTLASDLAPGATETITIRTTVNSSLAGGTVLENVAEVTAQDQLDFDSTPNNDDGDQSEDDEGNASVTLGEFIDLELTKSVDSAIVSAGGQVTFTITVTNNANGANTAATGVDISDVLPTGLTLVSATPSGNGTFASGVWSLVDPLAIGASQMLTLVANVDGNVAGDTTLTNVAQVVAANETDMDSTPGNDDGDQSEDDEANASVTVGAVIDLELEKTVNVATADVGDDVVWTVNVTNTTSANTAATNVQITDTLPTGVSVISATPSGVGTFAGGVWSLVEPLQPGAMATLTIVTSIDSAAGATDLINVAEVTAADQTDIDSTPANDNGDQSEDDEDQAAVSINPRIDLELQKTASAANVRTGDQVTWTITLTNSASANAAATGVQVSDVLPSGLTLQSSSPSSGTFSGGVWTLGGPLAPGETAALNLVTTVNSTATGGDVITNVAEVSAANETDIDSTPNNDSGDQSEDDEDNAQITVLEQVDLEVAKSVDQSDVSVGDTVTWTIVVANDAANANTNATGVTISDMLPTGVTFVSATATNGSFNSENGIWTLAAPLSPGASATLTILTTVNSEAAGSNLLNVAEIASQDQIDFDSGPGNDDGDQSEDDESTADINVALVRPMSKRDLLASS